MASRMEVEGVPPLRERTNITIEEKMLAKGNNVYVHYPIINLLVVFLLFSHSDRPDYTKILVLFIGMRKQLFPCSVGSLSLSSYFISFIFC